MHIKRTRKIKSIPRRNRKTSHKINIKSKSKKSYSKLKIKRRSAKRGSTKKLSTKRRSAKRRSTKKLSTKRRSTKRRSVKKRSTKRRSVKRRSSKRRSTKRRSAKRRSTVKKIYGGGQLNEKIARSIIEQQDVQNKEKLLQLCDELFKNTDYEEQYTLMKNRKAKDPNVGQYETINLCKNAALGAIGQKSPVKDKKFDYPKKKWYNIFSKK
jgi:hypothetical protein